MKSIAIQGDKKRGTDIISILEGLGGVNSHSCKGTQSSCYFTIKEDNSINIILGSNINTNKYEIFTIESFEELYPYKVGDVVSIKESKEKSIISGYSWRNDRLYYLLEDKPKEYYSIEELGTNIEISNILEENVISVSNSEQEGIINILDIGNIINFDSCKSDRIELNLGNDYEIQVEGGKIYAIRVKSIYPKKLEESLAILDIDSYNVVVGHKSYELESLQQLLIIRDSYWKKYSEINGLEEIWNPDFTDDSSNKYCIQYFNGVIEKSNVIKNSRILIFPTEDLRDEFYENFIYLIEECKELI